MTDQLDVYYLIELRSCREGPAGRARITYVGDAEFSSRGKRCFFFCEVWNYKTPPEGARRYSYGDADRAVKDAKLLTRRLRDESHYYHGWSVHLIVETHQFREVWI